MLNKFLSAANGLEGFFGIVAVSSAVVGLVAGFTFPGVIALLFSLYCTFVAFGSAVLLATAT